MIRLLIVDDDRPVLDMVMAQLAMTGRVYEVAAVSDLKELESAIDDLGGLDLLLTDMVLPGMDGMELFTMLRRRFEWLVPIFFSGHPYSMFANRIRGFLFLGKPFSGPQFTNALRRAERLLPVVTEVRPGATLGMAGFAGQVANLRLLDVVQMYILSHAEGTLHLTNEQNTAEGWMRIERGRLTAAACGGVQGEEAVNLLFQWHGGTFDFQPKAFNGEANIERAFESIMLDLMKSRDETLET